MKRGTINLTTQDLQLLASLVPTGQLLNKIAAASQMGTAIEQGVEISEEEAEQLLDLTASNQPSELFAKVTNFLLKLRSIG
jgi:hypothetical protein